SRPVNGEGLHGGRPHRCKPRTQATRDASESQEGEGNPVVGRPFDALPHCIAREWPQCCRPEAPDGQVQEHDWQRRNHRCQSQADVHTPDPWHQSVGPDAVDADHVEVGYPGLLGQQTVGAVAEEAADDTEAQEPMQPVYAREGAPPCHGRHPINARLLHASPLVAHDAELLGVRRDVPPRVRRQQRSSSATLPCTTHRTEHTAYQGRMTRQHADTLPIRSRYFADMALASGWTPGAHIPYDVASERS